MTHVTTNSPLPGIQELFAFRPETAAPMRALAQQLLRGPSSLTPVERETIAAVVSFENECVFCSRSHEGAANALARSATHVDDERREPSTPKMRALLAIARKVARGGKHVTDADVAEARAAGADDVAIHDAVLVAAAFCMFNRYVDGLAATTPPPGPAYAQMGEMLAEKGYVR